MKQIALLNSFLRINLLILMLSAIAFANGQDTLVLHNMPNQNHTSLGAVLAYRGFNNHFLEAGITYAAVGHGVSGVELTFMSNLQSQDDLLHGYSISRYAGFAFFEAALSGILYTNYKGAKFYINPSLGIGFGGFATLNYGYNFSFGKSWINERISRHEIRLVLRYPFGVF